MSQQCPNCGSPVQAGHRFCSNCGYTQAPTLPVQAVQTTTPAPASISQSDSAIDTSPPVTYVVQRHDPALPAGEASAVANSGLTVRPVGSEAQGQPYPAFVTPPLPGQAEGTPPAEIPRGAIPPPPPARGFDLSQVGTGSSTYGNFSAAAGPRLQGGAFAPYEGGAVRQLERESSQRNWLMPVLAAGIAALVLLLLGAVFLLVSKQQPAVVNLSQEEDLVKETVRISNDEQIKAWRDLDTEVLKGTRVGDVLKENIEMVELLKKNRKYAVPVIQRLDFVDVKIEGDRATVRTIETWTVTFYSSDTREVVQKNGPDTLHETYHMVKQNGKWMVRELEIDETPTDPGSTS
ncbi:MAG TPA: zinc ribbon domain-containing protein [Chloroflexia bacterium]|nr:zinc ribbon domain-containing protein [Chloroflexia bacterium]